MSRLTRDGTAEPVSRDQILRHARGQGNIHFPCSADHEQDCQPYPVDPYSAICDDHTYIHTMTKGPVGELFANISFSITLALFTVVPLLFHNNLVCFTKPLTACAPFEIIQVLLPTRLL